MNTPLSAALVAPSSAGRAPALGPAISVIIPTYRRAALLRRAIESAQRQTLQDIEIIVSDDEPRPGESWRMVQELAARDGRIRLIRNPGPHGQAGNMNHALAAARAPWIKPLYDDDVLRPDCLERMLEAVRGARGVSIVACLADQCRPGRPVRRAHALGRPRIQRLDGPRAILAMYLQDLDIGIPTQVLVRRSAITEGAQFDDECGLDLAIDAWWYAAVLQRGDLMLVNEPLVEQHQGECETISSRCSDRRRHAEFLYLRELLETVLDPRLSPPPIAAVRSQLRLIHAALACARLRPHRALRDLPALLDAGALRLFLRWALRRAWPGRFEHVSRQPVPAPVAEPAPAAQFLAATRAA